MTIEEQLRAAMRAEADHLDLDPRAWERVQGRVRRSLVVRRIGGALVAAALIGAVVGLAVWSGDDPGDRVIVAPPVSEPTTTATTPAVAEDDAFPGIWPFASQAEVDAYVDQPGTGMFDDADATALEFARVYLGMPEPAIVGPLEFGEGQTRFVYLTPVSGSPLVTTVSVHPFADGGAYSVTDVYTDNIELDEPQSSQVVGSRIALAGRSSAYEAQVDVEVREDGQVFGDQLGATFVMGGAGPDLAPFSGEVTIDPPTKPAGAVVLLTRSPDGSVQQARVIRVRFEAASPSTEATTFSVFYHRDEELVAVDRAVAPTSGVLRAALDALVAGPTAAEAEDGIVSLFSADTEGVIAGVDLGEDGTAVVDFAEPVGNASTSAGGGGFLAELNTTIFQFETVERIEYRLQGSCEGFWTWLQSSGCPLVERDVWTISRR